MRYFAIAFAVGFAIYLPTSKWAGMPVVPRVFWFVLYVLALLNAQLFPYLPKVGERRGLRSETSRLQSTNVAISRMTTAVALGYLQETEFIETAHGLLTSMKMEVQELVLERDTTYINATLMVEDPENADHLFTLVRANADRPPAPYPNLLPILQERVA